MRWMVKMFLMFLVLFTLADGQKINDVTIDMASNFRVGKCVDSSTKIDTITPLGLAMCIKKCVLRVRCKVVCYDKLKLSCILGYDHTALVTADSNFITNIKGFLHSATAQQAVGHRCSSPCYEGFTCFSLSVSSTRKCIQTDEIVVCGQPSTFLHASHNASASSLPEGTVVQYTCDDGYVKSGNSYITCQNNSEWTPAEFTCSVLSCGMSGYVQVHQDLCGKVYNHLVDYTTARFNCLFEGAVLARIDVGTKGMAMMSYTSPSNQYFIDGSDQLEEGNWVYGDGSPITTTLLSVLEKSIIDNDCLLYTTTGLVTGLCNEHRPYICELI